MKLINTLILALLSFALNAQTYNGPESVEFDAVNNRWLIGNTGSHQILALDSLGTLSVFVTGIGSGPYGIEIMGDTVFCCSGGMIKGYSLSTGAQVYTFNVGGSFLNGLTHDNSGNLYTTDFSSKKIIKVSVGAAASYDLATIAQTPNGIVYDEANNRCVFVTWGSNAPIRAIDLTTFAVTTVIPTSLGSCDGITRDVQGRYYVSSWGSQSVVRYDSAFAAPPVTVASALSSPADIFYDVMHDVLAIPNSGNNTVTFVDFNTTDVNQIQENRSVVFPNPASSILTIEMNEGTADEISVYSITGQLMFEKKLSEKSGSLTLNIYELNSGKYFYLIKTSEGKNSSGSFMIE